MFRALEPRRTPQSNGRACVSVMNNKTNLKKHAPIVSTQPPATNRGVRYERHLYGWIIEPHCDASRFVSVGQKWGADGEAGGGRDYEAALENMQRTGNTWLQKAAPPLVILMLNVSQRRSRMRSFKDTGSAGGRTDLGFCQLSQAMVSHRFMQKEKV